MTKPSITSGVADEDDEMELVCEETMLELTTGFTDGFLTAQEENWRTMAVAMNAITML
jgi:hypothetical protein